MPGELARFIAAKGSIPVHGVSLAVNGVEGSRFHVNLIPHTLAVTTLGALDVGARVNQAYKGDTPAGRYLRIRPGGPADAIDQNAPLRSTGCCSYNN